MIPIRLSLTDARRGTSLDICLKLNSTYLPAINNIATLYIKLRDPEKALKHASLAYSAQPSNPIAIKNFGAAQILNGESMEGINKT